MKRKCILILTIIIILIIVINLIILYFLDFHLDINNIIFNSYDENKEIISVTIEKSSPILFDHEFICVANAETFEITAKGSKGKCTMELPIENNYDFVLTNHYNNSESKKILDYIDNQLSFRFSTDKIYLAVGESTSINYIEKFVVPVQQLYEFKSSDNNIVSIEDGVLIANGKGVATIVEPRSGSELVVEVTDLISIPEFPETRKPLIPCRNYSEEDAKKLDELLEYYVSQAGTGTRAGAVAAARFLTLQFKYRIPYFYENGRVNETGVNLADGEGRYYKKGLYLNENKFADIQYKYNGPAIWGCPLRNWDNNEPYGFIAGNKMPNGLDCSGFVSWALKNGGFDPGDYGAGDTPGPKPQMTKLGKYTQITSSIINNNEIKTGDLLNYSGHIAIIIGQDDEYFYVAESLPHLRGVVATKYKKNKVSSTFPYVVFMDDFYKKDGNLTDFWK